MGPMQQHSFLKQLRCHPLLRQLQNPESFASGAEGLMFSMA